jgi:hypothetical protein
MLVQAMVEAWALAVELAARLPAADKPPPLADPAALEALVAAPLRSAAGRPTPGSSRPGTLHQDLLEPVRFCRLFDARLDPEVVFASAGLPYFLTAEWQHSLWCMLCDRQPQPERHSEHAPQVGHAYTSKALNVRADAGCGGAGAWEARCGHITRWPAVRGAV